MLNVNSDISVLKGVGAKTQEALNHCGIFTVGDLLLYFPRGYELVSVQEEGMDLVEDEKAILSCRVLEIKRDVRSRTGKVITTILLKYGEETIVGKWFNQPYIKNSFRIGQQYQLLGKIKKYKNENTLVNPKIVKGEASGSKILPKYSLTSELTSAIISKLVSQALETVEINENIPEQIIQKYKLCSLDSAVRKIHLPESNLDIEAAKKRLKFQELFIYSMKILLLKHYVKGFKEGIAFKIAAELSELKNKLPFELTGAQSRTVREILLDQKRKTPMNRLVQGDVGSGKTIVAIIAIYNVVKNGYQAAMMAPTEILANQHYLEVCKVLQEFDVNIRLLTGSTTASEKREIKESLKKGDVDILIGTHALIEEDVQFDKLGIVVADEQHRFGVNQRAKLFNKCENADILVMTATPIPRTLALYLYGDLDISLIDELPPGRKKIKTVFMEEKERSKAYELALQEISQGRQIYIVCPLIEENEELSLSSVETLYEELKSKYLKGISTEMLHGKMSPKEKDEIMMRFKSEETKVLVSTTVIEVGVNVPNASVMIIENAERFGLSQLHQLRGRVGRGSYESYCILIANAKSDNTKKRMSIMTESNDGFYIAEQDMKLRGNGDMFGVRQSGEDGLILTDIFEDANILKAANEEARRLINSERPEDIATKAEIIRNLENSSRFICFN